VIFHFQYLSCEDCKEGEAPSIEEAKVRAEKGIGVSVEWEDRFVKDGLNGHWSKDSVVVIFDPETEDVYSYALVVK